MWPSILKIPNAIRASQLVVLEAPEVIRTSPQSRQLHSNRASVCLVKRPAGEYTRQYPVRIVFGDGSTIVARHQVPREIIKLPLLLEDCATPEQRKAWMMRRKPKEVINIKKDDTNVKFDQMKYLKTLQMQSKKKRN